ncbi:thioesterase II family protein [Streptomyces avidinii]|uniref:Surfactin synthase thioesterase subunit n=1 Tax=Streptomyces avidinii TaxID=1895 RepID=A0ABS4L887_STRAV|nr:alpha/beta fold hydrolase [Streptomyces avidinii]MBP2038308.1 surfactin synthase thioesterase subunit [Streptomyces avidinii]
MTTTRSPAVPWWPLLRQREPVTAPRVRLLVFPHSGSGPNTLFPVIESLPDHVEVLGLSLPGRERRFGEPPGCRLDQVLDSVSDEVLGRDPLPTVVFGHSLGALLATRAARLLGPHCRAAVVSGQVPGRTPRRAHATTTEEDAVRLLRDGGGTPEWVLHDPEMLAHVTRVLRADLDLGREAAVGFEDVRIDVPLHVLGGTADPLVPHEPLDGWAAHTTGSCQVLRFDGDHFFLLAAEHRPTVAEVLRRALADN